PGRNHPVFLGRAQRDPRTRRRTRPSGQARGRRIESEVGWKLHFVLTRDRMYVLYTFMLETGSAPILPDDGDTAFAPRTLARGGGLAALAALALRAAAALTRRIEDDCETGKGNPSEMMLALQRAGRMYRQTRALAQKMDQEAE